MRVKIFLLIAIAASVGLWRGHLISGTLLLVSGCILAVLSVRQRLSTRRAAVRILKSVDALCEPEYEYARAQAQQFEHLELAWYDTSQRWLEDKGFALLGDEENLTFRRTSNGNRVLLRTMASRDGTSLAYLYHFKPAAPARMLAGQDMKVLELQTQFVDGTFTTTSNAEAAGKLQSPPGVDALRLPANTSIEAIFDTHAERVSADLARHPGLAAVRLGSLEDVHRSQNVLQRLKAAYRRDCGISREELQRIAGARVDADLIGALHADVERLRSEQQQRAA